MTLKAEKLRRRAKTAVPSIIVIALVVAFLPKWCLHLMLLLIGLIGTLEFDQIARGYGYRIYRLPVMLFVLMGIATLYIEPFELEMVPYISFGLICLVSLVPPTDFTKMLPSLGLSVMATGYLTMTVVSLAYLSFLTDANGTDVGRLLVAFCVLLVWAGDIFAYFAGSLFGKHKTSPNISPNKTWEGVAGNLLGNFLVAFAARQTVFPQLTWWDCFALTAIFGLLGFWGDLVESSWKRGAHLKDSGGLLPGHGGFLDRTDSIFLTAPAFYYYMEVVVLVRPV